MEMQNTKLAKICYDALNRIERNSSLLFGWTLELRRYLALTGALHIWENQDAKLLKENYSHLITKFKNHLLSRDMQ